MSYYYGQLIVVQRTDRTSHKYQFKCSYEGCKMKLIFKTSKGLLFINKEKSNFEHKHCSYCTKRPKFRMLEETYQKYLEYCRTCGSTKLFTQIHPDLAEYPIRNLSQIRTRINCNLNDVNTIIAELKKKYIIYIRYC